MRGLVDDHSLSQPHSPKAYTEPILSCSCHWCFGLPEMQLYVAKYWCLKKVTHSVISHWKLLLLLPSRIHLTTYYVNCIFKKEIFFLQQFDLWPISLTVLFQVHNKCATNVVPECNLGQHRDHILPPVSISPATLVCVQTLFPYASKVCYKAPPQFCWHPD